VKHITLQQARKRRGLTQEQLETESGISQAAISAIERGLVSDPAFSTVSKLAEALGVDPREFRFGEAAA
jgi:transcriptional regulator with XRE-family HTH domain